MIRTVTRRNFNGRQILSLLVTLGLVVTAVVSAVEIPNFFQAGETARAADVNRNFQALAKEIDALAAEIVRERSLREESESRVQELVDEVVLHRSRIEALESQNEALTSLTDLVHVETGDLDGMAGPHVIVEGANFHVRSGAGATDDGTQNPDLLTGLGNLIVGYNELPDDFVEGERGGSHNLVLGTQNRFQNVAGVVSGSRNQITGAHSVALSGSSNRAEGRYSVTLGGGGNHPNYWNEARGDYSAVVGGGGNVASGTRSTVSGGHDNEASGAESSVLGGLSNDASGHRSTVSGGSNNRASGRNSSVSGGFSREADEVNSWAACELTCN